MPTAVAYPAEPQQTAAERLRPRRNSRAAFEDAALFAVVVAVRLLIAPPRDIYSISADEPATLAMTRWLSGHGRWNMFNFGTWQPGLAVLLAPFHWLVDDLATVLRIALVVNSAVAAISAVVFVRVLVRLSGAAPTRARLAAAAVALAPTSIMASAYMWAEPLVTLCFVTAMLLVMRFYEHGRLGDGLGAVGVSVVGYLCHARLLVLAVTTAGLVMAALVVRRRRRSALVVALTAIVGVLLTRVVSSAIVDRVWESPADINTVGEVLQRLGDPVAVALAGTGQIWYQVVATAGIVGLGGWLIGRSAWSDPDRRSRIDARICVALATPLVGLSMLFQSDRWRFDHAIYGRYNDAILWPALACGLLWLTGRGAFDRDARIRLGAALASLIVAAQVATAAIVVATQQDLIDSDEFLAPMVPGVMAFVAPGNRPDVMGVTLVAAGVTLLLVMLSKPVTARAVPVVVALLVLGSVGAVRARQSLSFHHDEFFEPTAVQEIPSDVLPPGEPVRFAFDTTSSAASLRDQRVYVHVYQWFLPDNEFHVDRGDPAPEIPLVFAPVDDQILTARGARVVWQDPRIGLALWEER